MLAIAGAALDLAALTAVFKAAKPIAAATTAFDASEKTADDIVKLQDDLNAIAGLSEQIKKGIIAAAEAKAQAKLMIQSMFKVGNKLYIQIVPGGAEFAKLVAAAYYYAKAGVITFENFILELKAAKLIDDFAKLTGGEKLVLKNAFEKGVNLKNAPPGLSSQIDEAIKQGDFIKLEKIISGAKVVKTWEETATVVDDLIKPQISKLKITYPDAQMGYRGSLATGKKYSTGGPFDPTDWDVDAFIVSDDLAATFTKPGFRDGRNVVEIKNIADELESSFKLISGYRTEPGKPFTFKIFTEAEFNSIVKPN